MSSNDTILKYMDERRMLKRMVLGSVLGGFLFGGVAIVFLIFAMLQSNPRQAYSEYTTAMLEKWTSYAIKMAILYIASVVLLIIPGINAIMAIILFVTTIFYILRLSKAYREFDAEITKLIAEVAPAEPADIALERVSLSKNVSHVLVCLGLPILLIFLPLINFFTMGIGKPHENPSEDYGQITKVARITSLATPVLLVLGAAHWSFFLMSIISFIVNILAMIVIGFKLDDFYDRKYLSYLETVTPPSDNTNSAQ